MGNPLAHILIVEDNAEDRHLLVRSSRTRDMPFTRQ